MSGADAARAFRDLAHRAVRLAQAGDHLHPVLLRHAMAGTLRCSFLPPAIRMPLRLLDPTRDPRPHIVVVLGDAGEPAGPDRFPQATRLLRWSRFTMLHGAGGLPWHYEVAVEAVHLARCAVIIETDTATLPTWIALKDAVAPTCPGLIVRVPPGSRPHPGHGPTVGEAVH